MTEDREHDRTEERDSAARPVTAAARRERRASARDAAERSRTASAKGADRTTASSQARTRRVKDGAEGKSGGKAAVAASTLEKKGRATPKRDGRDKQPNVILRLIRFLREVVSELRKVIWPTRKQQVTYTVVVLVFVAVVVAVVYGLDAGFSKLVFTVFA